MLPGQLSLCYELFFTNLLNCNEEGGGKGVLNTILSKDNSSFSVLMLEAESAVEQNLS